METKPYIGRYPTYEYYNNAGGWRWAHNPIAQLPAQYKRDLLAELDAELDDIDLVDNDDGTLTCHMAHATVIATIDADGYTTASGGSISPDELTELARVAVFWRDR